MVSSSILVHAVGDERYSRADRGETLCNLDSVYRDRGRMFYPGERRAGYILGH